MIDFQGIVQQIYMGAINEDIIKKIAREYELIKRNKLKKRIIESPFRRSRNGLPSIHCLDSQCERHFPFYLKY